ncbi:MAG TPA: SDR family oxidoreductase [Acidimicrobiales bacterium]|nr:SDR family oxidoreductase [Acidimicrobiales bacterium]
MELTLTGKVALVTGGSRGIGEGIARAFAEAGATVVITARKIEGLRDAAARIDGEIHPISAHAGDPEAASRAVGETIDRFGRLDVLVNNAGTNPHMGRMIDVDLARWDKTFEVNLRGPLVWIQEAWRQWMEGNGGSVVNVASIGGITAGGPIGVYDLTKSALVFMTKHLATELGPKVRVNAIAPGLVKTDFARSLWEGGEQGTWPWAMQRLGEPGDIAPAALFLSSDAASWITGALLVVDGGGVLTGSL